MNVNIPSCSQNTPADILRPHISALPKFKDQLALTELSQTILQIRLNAAPILATTTIQQHFLNKEKGYLADGRPYKIHTFVHPATQRVNLYVSFLKPKPPTTPQKGSSKYDPRSPNVSPSLSKRSSESSTHSVIVKSTSKLSLSSLPSDSDLSRTITEFVGGNKIFHTCYQIRFLGEKLESILPKGRLSGKYDSSDDDPDVHDKRLAELALEADFLRLFVGDPDICQLEDAAKYMGSSKVEDPDYEEPMKVNFEKFVMYQELYAFDLYEASQRLLKDKLKPELMPFIAPILFRILRGINTVHSKDIVHRDIKPENIFLRVIGMLNQSPVYGAVLGDFGCAKKSKDPMKSIIGTKLYFSPEHTHSGIHKTTNKKPVDIWNIGYLFYFMLYKQLPDWMSLIDCILLSEEIKPLINLTDKPQPAAVPPLQFEKEHKFFLDLMQDIAVEASKIDTKNLVSLVPQENLPVHSDITLLAFTTLNALKTLKLFLEANRAALSVGQITSIKEHLAKLDKILSRKLRTTWADLEKVPCPPKSPSENLEDAILLLIWKMLRPNPKDRISAHDAMKILSKFCDQNGLLNAVQKLQPVTPPLRLASRPNSPTYGTRSTQAAAAVLRPTSPLKLKLHPPNPNT